MRWRSSAHLTSSTFGRCARRARSLVGVLAIVLSGLGGPACAGTPPQTVVETHAAAPASASPTPEVMRRAADVTIVAVGDLMLDRRVEALMEERGLGYPFERVLPLLQGADIVVGNMEGTFTNRGEPLQKQYTFRTSQRLAAALAGAGFRAVSLANNHTTDFGTEGLDDTLAVLRQAGVGTFGAGSTAATAEAPLVITAPNGARVAFVGFDDIGEVIFATDSGAGVARADPASIARAVRAARVEADYVVLFAHWGTEYTHTPTDRQRALARAAIEAGADLVLGAHPHVLQPLERMGDGLVLYSLGNFVFDLDADDMATLGEAPFQSAAVRITLSKRSAPYLALTPVRIDPDENRPRRATAEESTAIIGQLRELAPAAAR